MANKVQVLLVIWCLSLCMNGAVECFQICAAYPKPDHCLPGGVYDPVLQSCTGYNNLPCYQCYSGHYCDDLEDSTTCKLKAVAGNPLYLAEYWLNGTNGDPCTTTLAHYRTAYQLNDLTKEPSIPILPPLVEAIKSLHVQTGNAAVDGYHIVAGMGATMILNVAVAVLSKKILSQCTDNCPQYVEFFAQRPYYIGYANFWDFPTAKWNPDADPNSPWTIEILTYPNNPDGSKKCPLVKDFNRVILDMVYYWPMYTDITETLAYPMMIFSSSKHDGLAGSRFGWALVRDDDVAQNMSEQIRRILYSVSVDVELRVLTSMQAILNEGKVNGSLKFHKSGSDVISARFSRLEGVINKCPHLTLQNHLNSSGGYAWIHCNEMVSCEEYFAKVNLFGITGSRFGTTDQDIRFSMLMPSVEYEIFYKKMELLC